MKLKNYMWQIPFLLIFMNLQVYFITGVVDIFNNIFFFMVGISYYHKFIKKDTEVKKEEHIFEPKKDNLVRDLFCLFILVVGLCYFIVGNNSAYDTDNTNEEDTVINLSEMYNDSLTEDHTYDLGDSVIYQNLTEEVDELVIIEDLSEVSEVDNITEVDNLSEEKTINIDERLIEKYIMLCDKGIVKYCLVLEHYNLR